MHPSSEIQPAGLESLRSTPMLPEEVVCVASISEVAQKLDSEGVTGALWYSSERIPAEHSRTICDFFSRTPFNFSEWRDSDVTTAVAKLAVALDEIGFRQLHPEAAQVLLDDAFAIATCVSERGDGRLAVLALKDWSLGATDVHVEGSPHAVLTYFGPTATAFRLSELDECRGKLLRTTTTTPFKLPVGGVFISDGNTPHIGPPLQEETIEADRELPGADVHPRRLTLVALSKRKQAAE